MNKLFTKIAAVVLGATMATGVGVAVASSGKAAEPVQAAIPSAGTTTYSLLFSNIGTTGWTNSYADHSYTASDDVVISMKASKQTSTISDRPVTKGQPVELKLPSDPGVYISGFTFTAQQWGSKAQTITAHYSTNGGSSYTALSGTSTNFSITKSDLTSGTNAIKITFSSTSNQVGLTSFSVTYTALSQKLDTPSPSYNDTTKQVTWAAIEHASSYQVKVDSGSYATATSPYDVSGLTTGTSHTVYVVAKGTGSYTDSDAGSTTFTPTAPKVFTSISLSGTYPTTFEEGDAFDHTGMTVTAHFDDSSTSDVTSSATFSGYNMSTLGSQTVTVSVTIGSTTKTTTYTITVNEKVIDQYELIKSTNDLSAGSSYLIGGSGDNNGYFISTNQANNNRTATTGTVTDEKVTLTSSMQVITLGGSSGAWTLYATGGANEGYLYTATTGSNRLHTRAADSDNNSKWAITVANTGLATIHNVGNTSRGQMNYNYNSGSPIFACYASGGNLCIYKLVSTAESIQINKDSVSGLKGDTDNTVSITANNFTPTNITVSYSTSGVASVTKGTISQGVIPLQVSYTDVGSTTATITVKGGSNDYTADLDITVAAKPASMTIVHSDIHEGAIEIITDDYKQVSFTGEDTDGNAYAIAAGDVTPSATSGASHVTLSGSRITGASQGDAVVRYTLNALTSVYAELTVHVVDDYIETVGTPTFATGLTDTQGDSPDVSVFTSRPGTMHSGTATTVPFENYKFSYDSTYASSEYGSVFSYDFAHGTTVDATHKLQTIYVFCDIDQAAHGSYTVTVEQLNDPLREIHFTNVTDNEVDVTRGNTFQLEWAYTPTNPTDGKEVVFRVDESDAGVSVSVNSTGLISVSSSSGLGAALIVVESAHDETIYDWVDVSVTLESMTYQVDEEESWSIASSISVGDRVVIAGVHSDANYELTGVTSNIGQTASFESDPAGTFVLTVGEGNTNDSFTFSNGTSYLAYTSSASSGSNYLYTITNPTTTDQLNQVSWTVSISNNLATITNVYNTNRKILLNYNNGSPRFCAYTSATSATMHLPEIYKLTGGLITKDVDETLFNGVHNNFGNAKTYEWSETCSTFNTSNWQSACNNLKGISGYSNYKLNRAVGNISGNEIEVFIAKYDNIINKFGTTYDYLGRFSAGGINYGASRISPVSFVVASTNTVAIVVVVSMISVTTIGGYFFLRKRKETN